MTFVSISFILNTVLPYLSQALLGSRFYHSVFNSVDGFLLDAINCIEVFRFQSLKSDSICMGEGFPFVGCFACSIQSINRQIAYGRKHFAMAANGSLSEILYACSDVCCGLTGASHLHFAELALWRKR